MRPAEKVYEELYVALKDFGTWAHITESCWAVQSEKSATQIRDELGTILRSDDRLLVLQSANVAAWKNVLCRNEWMKENI